MGGSEDYPTYRGEHLNAERELKRAGLIHTVHGPHHPDAHADVAQVQALFGHASLDTSARYFRGPAETAAIVEAVFES